MSIIKFYMVIYTTALHYVRVVIKDTGGNKNHEACRTSKLMMKM